MPLESRLLMRENENLLTICLDLHMESTGSSDPLSVEDHNRYVAILRTALMHWNHDEGMKQSKRFDDAVEELCKATLVEVWRAR